MTLAGEGGAKKDTHELKTPGTSNIVKGCRVKDSVHDNSNHYKTAVTKSVVIQGGEVQEEEAYEIMDLVSFDTNEEAGKDKQHVNAETVMEEDGVRKETYEALDDDDYTPVSITAGTMPDEERESVVYDEPDNNYLGPTSSFRNQKF